MTATAALGQMAMNAAPAGPFLNYAHLSRPEKAAILVRLMIAEEVEFNLAEFPEQLQATLTRDLARMKPIDRATVEAVISEFMMEVNELGLSFPGSMEKALLELDGKISDRTLARLKREQGMASTRDPWERLSDIGAETLAPLVERESIEVAAVILSKIPVSEAAAVLELLPGERARKITYAVSQTSAILPRAVDRIGQAVLSQLNARPDSAFSSEPVERVGAILNSSTASIRDDVLDGLEETDNAFAAEVRKAIFTVANIPERLSPADVPKVIKAFDQEELLIALASAQSCGEEAAVEFLLGNMSKRMAEQLREGMEEVTAPPQAEAEAAMSKLTTSIRELEAAGDITLVSEPG